MIEINTTRFVLRSLTVDDVSDEYVSWVATAKSDGFILYSDKINIDSIKKYVSEIQKNTNTIFLGVYVKNSNKHIGNIKFDPVDIANSYTVVGVLIGDSKWKGKGIFVEIMEACGAYLKSLGIRNVYLGVDKANISAVKAYKKCGFQEIRTEYIPNVADGSMTMGLKI